MKTLGFFFISFSIGLCLPLLFYSRIFAANDISVLISPIPLAKTADQDISKPTGLTAFVQLTPVNILLLGVDGRRGDSNPRCDAIHTISFDPTKGKITIYSVPRGTPVGLTNAPEESTYISNVCHYAGVEKATALITKITGVKPDYTVKVGFSQTMGILRNLGLDTIPSLQFLRSRQYAIGDYQRSFNQANFIKDAFTNYLEQFYRLPKPVKYLVYKILDTNLGFDEADDLLGTIVKSGVYKDPNNIMLVTKPSYPYKRKEVHLTSASSDWQNDKEFIAYQENLKTYIDNLITKSENYLSANKPQSAFNALKTPFAQKIWLQLEDENERNLYHYQLLRLYLVSSSDKVSSASLLLDFITEMETVNNTELKTQAEDMLVTMTD